MDSDVDPEVAIHRWPCKPRRSLTVRATSKSASVSAADHRGFSSTEFSEVCQSMTPGFSEVLIESMVPLTAAYQSQCPCRQAVSRMALRLPLPLSKSPFGKALMSYNPHPKYAEDGLSSIH